MNTITADQPISNEQSPKKKYLSYSQISMFIRCPRSYYYRYIEKIKTPASGAMVQGRVWHQAIELNYRQKIDSHQDLATSEVMEAFSDFYDEAFQAEEIILDTSKGETVAGLKDQGLALLKVQHELLAPHVQPILVEKRFEISLGDDFPYTLMGVWDVIAEGGIVIDNKTWGKSKSQNEVDKDLQLTLYAIGYRATFNEVEERLQFDGAVKNKTPKPVRMTTTRSNADCRWALGLIENVAMAIHKQSFFPNPDGWHCSPKYCGFFEKCKGGN